MAYRQQVKCKAKRSSDGQPCGRFAMLGQQVCATHGGRAPRAKAKAARVEAERRAMERLSREGVVPVGNPLEAFGALAGECVRLKDYLGGRVERLEELRYKGVSGEQLRGELVAYGAALDRTIRVLEAYGRLNIDERLLRLTEGQAEIMEQVVRRLCEWLGITGDLQMTVWGCLAELLRASVVSGVPALEPSVELLTEVESARARFLLPDRTADLQRQVEELTVELNAVRAQRNDLREALRRNVSAPLAIEAPKPRETLPGTDVVVDAEPSSDVSVSDDVSEGEFVAPVASERRESSSWSMAVTWHSGDGYDD